MYNFKLREYSFQALVQEEVVAVVARLLPGHPHTEAELHRLHGVLSVNSVRLAR